MAFAVQLPANASAAPNRVAGWREEYAALVEIAPPTAPGFLPHPGGPGGATAPAGPLGGFNDPFSWEGFHAFD